MYKIIHKEEIADRTVRISVYAPMIAAKAKAGQFIILRTDEKGERIPLTISSTDTSEGTVTLIFQAIGKTTLQLASLNQGDSLCDFVGPLGRPTETEGIKKAAVVGGGLGCAIALPVARALKQSGAQVDMIAGFRTKDIIILEKEMTDVSTSLYMCTDDGSYGKKGFVTNQLKELIEGGAGYDCVFAIGPLVMMKFIAATTKPFGIKTIVSMNPIMIDGTGMCGGCRVTVDGKIKFACVDGPDFDGHLIDFDETIKRNTAYKEFEQHKCNLLSQEVKTNA